MERVYIETTVVSYLPTRLSCDPIVAGHQQTMHDWWDIRRGDYELCMSQLVLAEAVHGNAQAAQERLDVLAAMTVLEIKEKAITLTEELVQTGCELHRARPKITLASEVLR